VNGRGRKPLFLARQTYRRRRLADAARLYPFLAAFLFLLPVLWGPGAGERGGRATAGDGIYLMIAWAALILGAVLLSRALRRIGQETPGADGTTGGAGEGGE